MVIVVIHKLVTFQRWLSQVVQLQSEASYAGNCPKCGQLTHHNSERGIPHLNYTWRANILLKKKEKKKRKVHHLALLLPAFFRKCRLSWRIEAQRTAVKQDFCNRTDLASCCADTCQIQRKFPQHILTSSLLIAVIPVHYFGPHAKKCTITTDKTSSRPLRLRSPRLRKPRSWRHQSLTDGGAGKKDGNKKL